MSKQTDPVCVCFQSTFSVVICCLIDIFFHFLFVGDRGCSVKAPGYSWIPYATADKCPSTQHGSSSSSSSLSSPPLNPEEQTSESTCPVGVQSPTTLSSLYQAYYSSFNTAPNAWNCGIYWNQLEPSNTNLLNQLTFNKLTPPNCSSSTMPSIPISLIPHLNSKLSMNSTIGID